MDRLAGPHGWGCYRHAGDEGADMFKKKANDSKASENQKTDADATPIIPMAGQPQPLTGERDPITLGANTQVGPVSCIGSGMSIVGNIECNGPAQVFGRIQGEVRASNLVIGEGAQVEGSVIAQDVTVCGSVKGTIRAVRVTLQGGGAVEGDILHRSLSIDESSLFEGTSRRVENPTDPSLILDGKGAQKNGVPSPTLPAAASPLPSIDADLPAALNIERVA
jgi:cytoskeletal protein CcmA (bactofilin family)